MFGYGHGMYMWWEEACCLAVSLTISLSPFYFPSYHFLKHYRQSGRRVRDNETNKTQ